MGTVTRIPVRNLWLMQLFASELYRSSGTELADMESLSEDVAALVSQILADAVTDRLRTGVTIGFRRSHEDLRRMRGKIDLLGTERHRLLQQGRIRCTFDEIHANTPSNRLVRAALEKGARLPGTDSRCRRLSSQMGHLGVEIEKNLASGFRDFYSQRHLAADRTMLMAAQLLLELSIPDAGSPEFVTLAPDDDVHYLRRLFEKATYGFYRRHLSSQGWTINHGSRLSWPAEQISQGMKSILPGMITDIILRQGERTIIIDTKFTSLTKSTYFATDKIRSGYLYQIYSYLLSQHGNPKYGPYSEGLMLHPVVSHHTDEEFTVQGHRIRFATVDLRGTHETIFSELLAAVSPSAT